MFWRVTTFPQISPIEAILDKDDCTLEEVMNEDDIIQECKALNSRLVSFLGRREIIEQLIGYLSEVPEDEVNFKYSFTACEILCCELDDVLSQLISDETLMGQLFSLLDRPAPLNSTLAGYFGRVVGSLLSKRPQQAHEYLEANQGILDKLVAHVDTTSTVEVILRLIGADDLAMSTANEYAAWLSDTSLMQMLLDCLCAPRAGSNKLERLQRAAQQNVGNILVAVAHSQCSPMFGQLSSQEYLSRMLRQAANRDEDRCDVLQPVLLVCIALLVPKAPRPSMAPQGAFGMMQAMESQPSPEVEEDRRRARRNAATEIVEFLPEFTELLSLPEDGQPDEQAQPYGTLTPPLGRRRLTIVELGRAVVCTGEAEAIQAMLQSDFLSKVMELFKAYPFNNILHAHVRDILGSLIQAMSSQADLSPQPEPPAGPPGLPGALPAGPGAAPPAPPTVSSLADLDPEQRATLAEQVQECLFDNVSILSWLMEMSENAQSTSYRPRADRIEKPPRAAYHGHVLELAGQLNEAEKLAHRVGDNSIITAIQLSSGWASFIEEVVEPRLAAGKREAWEAPMPQPETATISDDFSAAMEMPDAFPNNDFSGQYETDNLFGSGKVRYMFDNDVDGDEDDEIDIVPDEPHSHSIDDDDDDSSNESQDSDVSDEGNAIIQPSAAPVELDAQRRNAQGDGLDHEVFASPYGAATAADLIDDDGADVVLEDDELPDVPVATPAERNTIIAEAASRAQPATSLRERAGVPDAARPANPQSAARIVAEGAALPDAGTPAQGLETGEHAEAGGGENEEDRAVSSPNWWKIPEKQLSEDELPPPPEPAAQTPA